MGVLIFFKVFGKFIPLKMRGFKYTRKTFWSRVGAKSEGYSSASLSKKMKRGEADVVDYVKTSFLFVFSFI